MTRLDSRSLGNLSSLRYVEISCFGSQQPVHKYPKSNAHAGFFQKRHSLLFLVVAQFVQLCGQGFASTVIDSAQQNYGHGGD